MLEQLRAVGATLPSVETLPDSSLIPLTTTTATATSTATAASSSTATTASSSTVEVEVPSPLEATTAAAAAASDALSPALEKQFRDVWGNNADEVAVLYAGTPALKGDFTRTGKRTKLGAARDGVNSAQRYVINNFQVSCVCVVCVSMAHKQSVFAAALCVIALYQGTVEMAVLVAYSITMTWWYTSQLSFLVHVVLRVPAVLLTVANVLKSVAHHVLLLTLVTNNRTTAGRRQLICCCKGTQYVTLACHQMQQQQR
jgi:hypothetical protein